MQGHRWYASAALTALFACALIAAGCGGDDETTTSTEAATTTTTSDASGADKIDAAVASCNTKAQELSEAAAAGDVVQLQVAARQVLVQQRAVAHALFRGTRFANLRLNGEFSAKRNPAGG